MRDLGAVLEQLKEERARLDKAIAALSGVVGNHAGKSGRAKRRYPPQLGSESQQPRGPGGRNGKQGKRRRVDD